MDFTTQCHDRQLITIIAHAGHCFCSPDPAPASPAINAHDAVFVIPLQKVCDAAGEVSVGNSKLANSIALCGSRCSCVTRPHDPVTPTDK